MCAFHANAHDLEMVQSEVFGRDVDDSLVLYLHVFHHIRVLEVLYPRQQPPLEKKSTR